MSDQIIVLIISNLSVGIFTIASGLVIYYITHRQTSEDEKRKELREAIEKIYRQTWNIDSAYGDLVTSKDDTEELVKCLKIFVQSMQEIRTFVALCVPALTKETKTYLKTLNPTLMKKYIKWAN